jgi:hypothetical protein
MQHSTQALALLVIETVNESAKINTQATARISFEYFPIILNLLVSLFCHDDQKSQTAILVTAMAWEHLNTMRSQYCSLPESTLLASHVATSRRRTGIGILRNRHR